MHAGFESESKVDNNASRNGERKRSNDRRENEECVYVTKSPLRGSEGEGKMQVYGHEGNAGE
jgi:hypothetical protein